MNVVLTGNEGFIGKNLEINLRLNKKINLYLINRKTPPNKVQNLCKICDLLIHVAGSNRPSKNILFKKDNEEFTKKLINYLNIEKKNKKIIYFSTSKVKEKSHYGSSKKKAEQLIINNSKKKNYKYFILRLPNVYGKWCKPNYNSFLSTIFFNITRNKKIEKISTKKTINIIYIDDVIDLVNKYIDFKSKSKIINVKGNTYNLQKLYLKIKNLWNNYQMDYHDNTGTGLDRKLFSTMISYIPKKNVLKKLKSHTDKRGSFYEFIKTKKSGQFSFFTINVNKERGGHFHNTKNEKFMILQGKVNFKAKNLKNNESISKVLNSGKLNVVSSLPGWVHTFKNIGKTKALVAVWANEILNKKKMDTYRL